MGVVNASVTCLAHSAQMSSHERILAAALQVLNPQDHNLHFQFCMDFQQQPEEDRFAEKLIFSDEVTFHVCDKVNHHNVRIWGTKYPHAMVEHINDSPKVNVFFFFFAISSCKVYRLYFFAEPIVITETCKYAMVPMTQINLERFSTY
jgi:hypothetical protein